MGVVSMYVLSKNYNSRRFFSVNKLSPSLVALQNWQHQQQQLEDCSNHPSLLSSSVPSAVSSWWDQVTLLGSTSCDDVRLFEQEGLWKDPNGGQYFIRKIIKAPHHFVSLHNNNYDHVRHSSIFIGGNYYEHHIHDRFERILAEAERTTIATARSLPIVIDVGANLGYYSLLSAARQHAVISFEINPSNLIRLCESIQWNSNLGMAKNKDPTTFFGPIRLFRNGVSNQHNQSLQVVVPGNPGEASIQDVSQNDSNRRQQLESFANGTSANDPTFATTVTLDSFAIDHGWLPTTTTQNNKASNRVVDIAILKIDTEGHEPFILQGATKLLSSHLIRNILIEYRMICRDTVFEIILESGYVLVDDNRGDVKKGTTMLTKEASKSFIDELHNTLELRRNTSKPMFEDLWFRVESHKLP
ncbi:FkbM family methyltransferase [Nitzschia inconspicua]|uniref:FkbM family methyltransferase n=1 Tax=Nitzschia inconspicua TaxID=303405 RepID=A0A9K3KB81_9STRA|nr:FkbM family methyltransferase [Nitzschia inconspicua]